jgi:copper transport protein
MQRFPKLPIRVPNSSLRRCLVVIAMAAGLTTAFASPASAHAELEQSTPASNATLTTAPTQIDLSFGEGVELKLSSIAVLDHAGKHVETGSLQHLNGNGKSLSIKLSGIVSGQYTVNWHNVSVDSHPESGSFTFTVAIPESASATSTSTTAAVTATTVATLETPASSGNSSSNVGIIVGALILIALLLLVIFAVRQRKD